MTIVISLFLLGAAWREKGAFIDYEQVSSDLLQEPIQTPTDLEPFSLSYAGRTYTVVPVADYEIWGLVVSHNDIEGFMDLVHDETSVDTKDICVIWGANLRNNDFHNIEFWSGDYTCYTRYMNSGQFEFDSISNNHLITDAQSLRDMIAGVRIGDQVHVVGSLVNYQEAGSSHNFWRRSSTTRRDSGNNACEVVFVDEFEILQKGTPLWYALYPFAWFMVVLAAVGRVGLSVWGILREAP